MRTARSLPYGGVYVWGLPNRDPPLHRDPLGQRPLWTETPLDRDPPVMWPVVYAGTKTPYEQNHKQV